MSTLYELTGEVLELQNLLENAVEDEQVFVDTLEAVQGEFDLKIESYCKIIKNLEAQIESVKPEIKRLTDRKKTLENNVDKLKAAMFEAMKATGNKKVNGDLFTVSIRKNGGKAPVIVDVDTADLPDELVKITEAPDLEAIRELLDKGKCEFAHYGERGESLTIK